jgi:hypothetical protein
MKRKDSFDALIADYSPHCESFVYTSALAGDDCAGKDLCADFVPFFDRAANIYNIAYFKMRRILLEASFLSISFTIRRSSSKVERAVYLFLPSKQLFFTVLSFLTCDRRVVYQQ